MTSNCGSVCSTKQLTKTSGDSNPQMRRDDANQLLAIR